jgi:flagellin
MSSIMTNASAMTALKTLNATNKGLATTQSRISTGYRVAEASDNAAYWSIATTMRSDNKALSTVKDALGLGAAKIDTAYTGMKAAIDVADEIKTKLVAAREPGVDKSKIQAEITQLQGQLTANASASAFSGENWLAVKSDDAGYNSAKSIVSSFTRSASNAVSVGTINIDVAKVALFDASATAGGLLEQGAALASMGGIDAAGTTTAGTATTAGTHAFAAAAMTLGDKDVIEFSIALDGGASKLVTINKATVDAALGTTDGVVAAGADTATVLNAAFANAGVTGVSAANASGTITLTSSTIGVDSAVAVSGAQSSDNGNFFDLTSINIVGASDAQLETYISGVDRMIGKMTSAASDLGAAQKRVDLQSEFVTNLMDTIDRGVGTLVDADMNKESTRLQALQVQQQLGIQALSIANGNSQTILSLFRG